MEGIRQDSAAARFVADALNEPFVLIDVGCSGGLGSSWNVFGDKLTAYAFDPAVSEIERLAREETRPDVHYVAAFIGAPADHPVRAEQPGLPFYRRNPSERLAWRRTSILHEAAASGAPPPALATTFVVEPAGPYEPTVSGPFSLDSAPALETGADEDAALMTTNEWHKTRLADRDRPISLPRYLEAQGVGSVDFIKIDCDGPDFEILSSMEPMLSSAQVLALSLEVNFIGGAATNQHTFHNTDRLMRRNDFDLADLTVRRYASSALPFLYTDPHPWFSRNLGGRPYQGDALYARDFGWSDTNPQASAYSDDKLLKLVAVMALFGRVDQAAELLIMFRARLSLRLDVDKALDLLALEAQELQAPLFDDQPPLSYIRYMAPFEADDPAAYNAVRRLDALLQEAVARSADLEAKLAAAIRARDAAQAQLAAVLGSPSWKVTAPLRRLRGR